MFGIDAQASKDLEAIEPEDFLVWPDNWPVLQVFMAMQTQWRMIAGMGGVMYQGIDYGAFTPAVLRGLGVTMAGWPEIFNGLRVMERAALTELNSGRQPGKNSSHGGR
jgi:hypothetical protein